MVVSLNLFYCLSVIINILLLINSFVSLTKSAAKITSFTPMTHHSMIDVSLKLSISEKSHDLALFEL